LSVNFSLLNEQPRIGVLVTFVEC